MEILIPYKLRMSEVDVLARARGKARDERAKLVIWVEDLNPSNRSIKYYYFLRPSSEDSLNREISNERIRSSDQERE